MLGYLLTHVIQVLLFKISFTHQNKQPKPYRKLH
jgi:hypothetical protein